MITIKLRHVRPSASPSVRQSVAVLPFHPLPSGSCTVKNVTMYERLHVTGHWPQ